MKPTNAAWRVPVSQLKDHLPDEAHATTVYLSREEIDTAIRTYVRQRTTLPSRYSIEVPDYALPNFINVKVKL